MACYLHFGARKVAGSIPGWYPGGSVLLRLFYVFVSWNGQPLLEVLVNDLGDDGLALMELDRIYSAS